MISLDFLDNNYVDNRSESEKIEEKIAISIIQGDYYPGQKLSEQKLCDTFNISRIPAREILNRLSKDGYISLIQNRGAFVVGISEQSFSKLLDLKNLLYPQVVAWAAEHISADEFSILEETFGFIKFYAPTLDIDKCRTFAMGFDKILYSCSRNDEAEKILNKIDFIINHYRKEVKSLPINYMDQLVNEYTQIFEAIKTRNIPQATMAAQARSFRQVLRLGHD